MPGARDCRRSRSATATRHHLPTLRVFLAAAGSYTASATQLAMHKNSVKYRVEKAEQDRGRPIRGDRLDVELARHACHWLGRAVLSRTT